MVPSRHQSKNGLAKNCKMCLEDNFRRFLKKRNLIDGNVPVDNKQSPDLLVDDKGNSYENTPLMKAVVNNNLAAIQLLTENCRKMMKTSLDKLKECSSNEDIADKLLEIKCSFPVVMFMENVQLTKLMLNRGCSVNERLSGTGETALHLAVNPFHLDNINILVANGAEVNARDAYGYTPLDRLETQSGTEREIYQVLIDRGASLTAEVAANLGTNVLCKMLSHADECLARALMPFLDLSERNQHGETTLHRLARIHNPELYEVLKGYNIDVDLRDSSGFTPLDLAADRELVENVQFFLENGADPYNVDENQDTALFRVLIKPKIDMDRTKQIVELLIYYGADVRDFCEAFLPIFHFGFEDRFELLKPIIAHLALLESSGFFIHDYIASEINHTGAFQNYFDCCKSQIEELKEIIVSESISMHELVFESREKLALYVRNRTFVADFESMGIGMNIRESCYRRYVQFRVSREIEWSRLREEAGLVVCEITGMPISMRCIIGSNVIKYLSRKEVQNLCQV